MNFIITIFKLKVSVRACMKDSLQRLHTFLMCSGSLHALMNCIKLITSAFLQRAEMIVAALSSLRSSSTPAAPHSLHLKRLKHESGAARVLCSSSPILSCPFPLTVPLAVSCHALKQHSLQGWEGGIAALITPQHMDLGSA